jgi:orotidine-5'-phosphate decarboxylase
MIHEVRPQERIILPLDGMDGLAEIQMVVRGIREHVGPFKLGLEAMSEDLAHRAADYIIGAGGIVFWDGKFNDIPNTEGNAVEKLIKRHPTGIWAANVHGNSGRKSITAAVENRGDTNILGVTVLTSQDEEDTQAIYGCDPQTAVLRLAKICVESGVQGLICSPKEVAVLRKEFGEGIELVTPGVRPAGADAQDQARVMTPGDAIRAGSSYLVIGRPITRAEDRQAAATAIAEEIAETLAGGLGGSAS